MTRAEQVTDAVAYHGEGPVWIERLHWVDMLAGDVLSLDEAGEITRRHVGTVAAVVRPRAGGGLVYAVERGFVLEDAQGDRTALPPVWTDPAVRMNEGGCDPDGRLYVGSMAYDQTPGAASLHRLDPDGTVTPVLGDLTISNGLEWDPTGRLAYYVDSPTGRVDVFDYDRDQGLTCRRPFANVEGGDPDGLTVDSEGGVWVAVWGGSAVHRYDATGSLSEVIELPVTQVTACTFGGPDLSWLFVTTSREGLAEDDQPRAGAVFVADPGVRGLPVRPFAG